MGPISKLLALALAIAPVAVAPVSAQPETKRTEVVLLGVDHGAQLVNRRQQPAALRAFLSAAAPDAVCVERSPGRFARGDHYEFTFEIQDVILPWARETKTPLCPFDWLPSAEDTALAFGIDDLERDPLRQEGERLGDGAEVVPQRARAGDPHAAACSRTIAAYSSRVR